MGAAGAVFSLVGAGNLGSPGISGVAESLPVVLSRCTPGAGTCAGRGGRVRYRGPLCSVLRYAVRPMTFTAARAPHRASGLRDGPEQGVSGEHGTRGPSCTAPPPSFSSLPPPALSRKVPKRSPNVRKRNFLFPTLERAALRWLRGDLGTLLRRGRRPGVEEGGKDGGGNAEAPSSSFPLPDPALLFQRAVFSLRPSLPRQVAPP